MRQVFFSFHYERDNWRVQQIKNMGVIEGQKICSSNEWEQIKKRGDSAIKSWIDEQMKYKSCVIVLIGQESYGRKWINYEIQKAWQEGKALFGIYIHNLKDREGKIDNKGKNPFDIIIDGQLLSNFIKTYDAPKFECYNYIQENLNKWIENAIKQKR